MNKPIRTLAVGCLLLFAALLINANYVQVIRANDLNDAAANKRARDAECSRERGPIIVGGQPVARSVPSNDSLEYQRRYTEWQQYANITGYFSCIYGTTGIENTENSLLSGSDERLFVNRMIDLVGNEQPKGGSVELTIDPKAQQAAFEGLQNLEQQYGPTKGAVVALDPSTGAILAMVSQPTYNPNLIATHDPEAAKRAFQALVNAPDNRGLNRAAQLTYPPGSTFKLVTSAAALSNGYTPESRVKGGFEFDMPGSSDTIKNENGSNCGGDEITLKDALRVSCNVAYADLGVKRAPARCRTRRRSSGSTTDARQGGDTTTLDLIWDGDGVNPNAGLTIFRHFDQGSVVQGLVGTPPKTAWVIGYPLLERIHYLLVAGFDAFGNLGHQLNTRMYMDFLRMEGEANFIVLLPRDSRKTVRDYWYRDAPNDVKDYLDGASKHFSVETGVAFKTKDPAPELMRDDAHAACARAQP